MIQGCPTLDIYYPETTTTLKTILYYPSYSQERTWWVEQDDYPTCLRFLLPHFSSSVEVGVDQETMVMVVVVVAVLVRGGMVPTTATCTKQKEGVMCAATWWKHPP